MNCDVHPPIQIETVMRESSGGAAWSINSNTQQPPIASPDVKKADQPPWEAARQAAVLTLPALLTSHSPALRAARRAALADDACLGLLVLLPSHLVGAAGARNFPWTAQILLSPPHAAHRPGADS
eukprot:6210289-Pleurochrysis_carterae.AAC.2